MKSLLKQKKLSETPFRLEVLEIFQSAKSAIPVRFIEKRLTDYNRITLYRTLKTFVEKGIIHPITIAGKEVNYGLCQEVCAAEDHQHDHVHLECNVCSAVYCVEISGMPNINLGNHQIDSIEIQAKGICENCVA